MICSDCHDSFEVRLEDVAPLVEMPASVFGVDVVPVVGVLGPNPSYITNARSVNGVFRRSDSTKVRDSIVVAAMINMVKKVRLITMIKKPANAVRLIGDALVSNDSVPMSGVNGSGNFALVSPCFVRPSQITRFWVIAKDIANRVWNNPTSHIKPHFDLVRGLAVVAVSTPIILSGCATSKGNARQAQHSADQIKMVQVQREAMEQEALVESQERAALYQAISSVAATNPEHSPAALVALAVIGVSSAEADPDAPVVTLQQQRNESLELVKALAPTVGNLITGVGIAAIQADVNKNASDNNRQILLGDQASDLGIVQAVAGLGTAAANSVGTEVGGDYYSVTDNGTLDQSVNTADSNNTTTTTETTNTTSTEVSLNTTLNYDGRGMTLSDLITQLQNAGATYSIDLDGDGTPDVEGGDGETPPIVINCDEPQFSPAPPECSEA